MYLYVAKCGPFYKVGQASDPRSRLSSLASGCPFALSLVGWASVSRAAATTAERRAHDKLDRFHHRKEWFRAPAHVVLKAMHDAIVEAERIEANRPPPPARPPERFPREANGVRLVYN